MPVASQPNDVGAILEPWGRRFRRFTRLRLGGRGVWFSLVAIEAQAVVTIGKEDVGQAVGVVIDPGDGSRRAVFFFGQELAIVLELAVAEVGVELEACGSAEQEVGLAVAIVVGPGGAAAAADQAGERALVEVAA